MAHQFVCMSSLTADKEVCLFVLFQFNDLKSHPDRITHSTKYFMGYRWQYQEVYSKYV